MTSLEIAQVTGKMHKDVMKAIRNMEPAWEKERGRKFALTQIREEIPNGGYRLRPVYMLTKTECLYVATKFNDVARARLVLRWEELERERIENPDTCIGRVAHPTDTASSRARASSLSAGLTTCSCVCELAEAALGMRCGALGCWA